MAHGQSDVTAMDNLGSSRGSRASTPNMPAFVIPARVGPSRTFKRKLGMRLQVNGRHYMYPTSPSLHVLSGNIALIEAQHALAMMLHLCRSNCSTVLAKHSFRILTSTSTRSVATIRSSIPHEDRTATEPRENRLEPVILSHIREVNEHVRLLRLNAVDPNHTIKVRLLQPN